jgi:hypothetical protein
LDPTPPSVTIPMSALGSVVLKIEMPQVTVKMSFEISVSSDA